MTIQDIWRKINSLLPGADPRDVATAVLIVIVAFGGFALGRASVTQEVPAVAIYGAFPAQSAPVGPKTALGGVNQAQVVNHTAPSGTSIQGGEFVASKTGTKYHFPWCPGAQSMRDENKIWFATKEEAERAGYTPASNCKGL